ncbi:MAG: hypothetical protein GX946_08010 [Oligosphaeraceae bacterium]|nr:hypothetical protein [Oligosphaeraceae bacterium]
MDFLTKHYEKLILLACLLCLIVSIFAAISGVSKEDKKLAKQIDSAKVMVSGDKILPPLDLSRVHTVEASLRDPRLQINITEATLDAKKGNLLQSKRYIICKNPQCGNLLHVSSDKCSFCGTDQDQYKDTMPEDDTDNDGIPDLIEKKYAHFLNYLDPYDAFFDEDGDGFLNIEEYQAGTDMANPEDFPPLALLLRVQNVAKVRLPFVVHRVRTLDSELKSDWKVEFTVAGSAQRPAARIGEEIVAGFKVSSINDAKDLIGVESREGKRYNMRIGETAEEDTPTAAMLFLASRERGGRIMRVIRKVGEEFYLEKERAGMPYREHYRIIAGTSREDLKVAQLDQARGEVIAEFEIRTLDVKRDFIPQVDGARRGGSVSGEYGEGRRAIRGMR